MQIIELEERGKVEGDSMGICLEYLVSENIPVVICGLAKADKPKGLLNIGLKFLRLTM